MKHHSRTRLEAIISRGALLLAVIAIVALPAYAQRTQYLDDGAMQNPLGGWTLPAKGSCVASPSLATRAECVALRIGAADSAACTAANGSWTTSYCEDVANAGNQTGCEAAGGRIYNAGICGITMKGYDRNNVQCTLLGGTWKTWTSPAGVCVGSWIMPDAGTFTPPLLNRVGPNPSTGDQCLRCHRSDTEWNGPRVRDVEGFLQHGHKNMVKPIVPGVPQYGTDGHPYPADEAGNAIDWNSNPPSINVGGTSRDLVWLVNNWMAPLVRSYYEGPASTSRVCTIPTYTVQADCELNGGQWVLNAGLSYSCARCHTTGYTSDAVLQTAKQPEASFPGVTWTRNGDAPFGTVALNTGIAGDVNKTASWDLWGIGCNKCHAAAVNVPVDGPVYGTQYSAPTGMSTHHNNLTTFNGAMCSDPRFTTQAVCEANGASWLPTVGTASCSVAGICKNLDPALNTQALCEASQGVGAWFAATDVVRCLDIHEWGKEYNIPAYAAARYTGNQPQRGQVITALCLNCHRSDNAGIPREPNQLWAGNSHGVLGLVGHAVGQAYLNSPHAKYTGTFAGIATGTFNYAGTGQYKSFFMAHAEANNVGNGCTGCHDVHKSIEHEVNPAGGWLREECTECHAKTQATTMHPAGVGTPFEHGEAESCEACHMAEPLLHLWRINVDPNYRTFPVNAVDANAPANTAPDGDYTQAVWNDVDIACGKCHGGGENQQTATITGIFSGSSSNFVLSVTSAAGFDKAAKVTIPGAGGLEPDGVTRTDFQGTIREVDLVNNRLRLLGAPALPAAGLVNRSISQNYTLNGAAYKTKATLAAQAAGMHQDKPVVRLTVRVSTTNALQVDVEATGSTCSGSAANCDAYEWDFGDGATASGITAQNVYAAPGTYTIELTVHEYGVGETTATRTVTLFGNAPSVAGTCTFDPDTWSVVVTDASTAANGIKQVIVNWGDATVIATDTTAPFGPFNHTYLVAKAAPGFVIRKRVTDNIGMQTTVDVSCNLPVAPAYFAVGGNTLDRLGAALGGVKVQVLKGTTVVRTGYSVAGTGAFSLGTLKPGTYTLAASKVGYTFPAPTTVVVGPSSPANVIQATAP
jgi:hypothetical protein